MVISTTPNPIDWNARGKNRVVQNARNLLSLVKYELAYERIAGIDPDVIDSPPDEADIAVKAEVYRNFGTYMRGLPINSVDIVHDNNGSAMIRMDITT